jgi:hypothetical protein
MALTQTAWTVTTVNGRTKMQCSVTATTAENDAYTLKTPKQLNPYKPWTLILSTSAASDGAAVPADIWCGTGDDFAISGNDGTVAATSGFNYKVIMDDIGYAAATTSAWLMDPFLPVADVVTDAAKATGLKVKIPVCPYYAFNLDAGSAMLAHTGTWTIIQ